jgi:hypothetical protein
VSGRASVCERSEPLSLRVFRARKKAEEEREWARECGRREPSSFISPQGIMSGPSDVSRRVSECECDRVELTDVLGRRADARQLCKGNICRARARRILCVSGGA